MQSEAVEDDCDPVLPDEPKAKRGDIYQMGRHRLICGDSTDAVPTPWSWIPKYVDAAIARWEDFTGEKAVLLNE